MNNWRVTTLVKAFLELGEIELWCKKSSKLIVDERQLREHRHTRTVLSFRFRMGRLRSDEVN